jgi:ribosome biogenesis protein NSA2
MPQGDYIDLFRKRNGYRFDFHERTRKKQAREAHKRSQFAQKVKGLRAKLYNKKRFQEKAQLKKT